MSNNKICNICTNEKSLAEFYKDKTTKDGYNYACKECSNSRKKSYIKETTNLFKKCISCNLEKEVKEFHKGCNKDGLNNNCKECWNKISKENNSNNKERRKEYNEKNKEHNYEYTKNWINENKDRFKLLCKKHRILNKDKRAKDIKEWNKNNKDKVREYHKIQIKINPQYKLRKVLRIRLYQALKAQNSTKSNKTFNLLGCFIEQFKQYIEQQFLPEMNWSNHGTVWEIDHIKPCSSFNLTDPKEQAKCFHYTNMQPLFKTTLIAENLGYINYIGNREKGNK